MKYLLIIHFALTLIILISCGTGFFIPAMITLALVAAQRIARKLDFVKGALPAWYKILGICYGTYFLLVFIKIIL
jgi:hypothetical protein